MNEIDHDAPLPATLKFVFSVGALIFVGWVLMFILLQDEW